VRIYRDMGDQARRPGLSAALDRIVTVWSCLLAPPLTFAALGLTLFGVVPWYVPAGLFATVVLPPLVVTPVPVVAEPGDADLEEALREQAHAAATRVETAPDGVEPPGGERTAS
jgi:hypothetical protein